MTERKNVLHTIPSGTRSYVCLPPAGGSAGGDCLIPRLLWANMDRKASEKNGNGECHKNEPCNTGLSAEGLSLSQ
jgi:hypothetical protein